MEQRLAELEESLQRLRRDLETTELLLGRESPLLDLLVAPRRGGASRQQQLRHLFSDPGAA